MAAINIDFPWSRGRTYKVVEPTPPSDDAFTPRIDEPHIQQTGPSEPLERPLLNNPHLYLDFAQLDGSPESCRRFAQKWGLLRTHAEVGARERLSDWREQIRTMKESVEGLRRAIEEKVALSPLGLFITDEIELFVALDKLDNRPVLSFHPRSLVKAMRIQLAQSIASGKAIEICQACNRWFETGGRGAGTKRANTKFCSDKCRNDFHYNQRRVKK